MISFPNIIIKHRDIGCFHFLYYLSQETNKIHNPYNPAIICTNGKLKTYCLNGIQCRTKLIWANNIKKI